MKLRNYLSVFISLFLMPLLAHAHFHAYKDIGNLKDYVSIKDKGERFYRFSLPSETIVSIFLNGLSAGYQVELLDARMNILAATINAGSSWPVTSASKLGSIVISLKAQNYYLRVTSASITGNPNYRTINHTFTLNLIPDNARDLVIIAASDSEAKMGAHYITTGVNDAEVINLALAALASKNGGRILLRPGTYFIYQNILTTVNNLTFMGTGWDTILKIGDYVTLARAGVLRSRFLTDTENQKNPSFYKQHFMHFAIDGNKTHGTFFQTSVANFGTYSDSIFEDIRAHDFPRYGFDPHGIPFGPTPTERLLIKDCLADHNDQDGIVCDDCIYSLIIGSIADANGRHGINIVTGSWANRIESNLMANNGANGITIHPGAKSSKHSNYNQVTHNIIRSNGKDGVYIQLGEFNRVHRNEIEFNHAHDVNLNDSHGNFVSKNKLRNLPETKNTKFGISITSSSGRGSSHNQILNNIIDSMNSYVYKFGISEDSIFDDYNIVVNNTLRNIELPIRLVGSHSVARYNHT